MNSMIFKSIFCILLLSGFFSVAQNKKQYNVLVILTDDQRFNTIHALGNSEVQTPNIDRLVNSGTTFTQAHIMGSLAGAVCAPSRAMLMTGRSVFQVHQDGGLIPAKEKTFPEVFRANGYHTFGTGKWHSDKLSYNRSFASGDNIFFGGMHDESVGGHEHPVLNHYDSTGVYKSQFSGDKFSSVAYADAAVDFLQQLPNKDPFLMYVAFTAPHDPRTPPAEYRALYDAQKIQLPKNFMPQHPFDNGELKIRDEVLLGSPRKPEAVKEEIAKYYAMITEVDHEIGRVLDALKASGQYDNTIIVFAADNGLAVGQHGLLGKQNLYDHSMRVPLIFSGPGIPANERNDAYCYLTDVFSTLCHINNVPVPNTVTEKSLDAAFSNKSFKGRKHLFLTYSNLQRAVVKDNYKLVLYNVNGQHPVQLFDLNKDPLEINNLAENKVYAGKLKTLKALLQSEMKAYGDFCNLTKADWGMPGSLTSAKMREINP